MHFIYVYKRILILEYMLIMSSTDKCRFKQNLCFKNSARDQNANCRIREADWVKRK